MKMCIQRLWFKSQFNGKWHVLFFWRQMPSFNLASNKYMYADAVKQSEKQRLLLRLFIRNSNSNLCENSTDDDDDNNEWDEGMRQLMCIQNYTLLHSQRTFGFPSIYFAQIIFIHINKHQIMTHKTFATKIIPKIKNVW